MAPESRSAALARLYDLDLAEDPGDLDLYLALAERLAPDGSIVELAVGTGRIAVPIAAAGHRVVGVDVDPAMLARATARARAAGPTAAKRLQLIEGDLATVAVPVSGGFGLAILGLSSILLLAERGAQAAAIHRMRELLGPGGIAVIDAWLPAVEDLARFDGRVSLEWLRTDSETGREVTKLASARYDPARRIVTLTTIFEEAEPGSPPVRWTRSEALRLVGPDELVGLVEQAGFQIETLAGDHELSSTVDAGSERVVLVARRPGRRGSP